MERLSPTRQDTKRGRRRTTTKAVSADGEHAIHLAAVGVDVIVLLALESPLVGHLVSEDTCWQFALEAWRSRKPLWLRPRARRAWRKERGYLDAKRARICKDAAALGYQVPPPTPRFDRWRPF